MVYIQFDLNDQENKLINIYKAANGLKSKAEAIKALIQKLDNN